MEWSMPKFDYDRLLKSTSIIEVAKQLGMKLENESANQAKTLCPFHDDRTPSLLLDASKDQTRDHYHCFACGAHGDAIDLVKKQLGLGFGEAVEWLSPGSRTPNKGRGKATKTLSGSGHTGKVTGLNIGYSLYKKASDRDALIEWATNRHLDVEVLDRAGFVHAKNNQLSRKLKAYRNRSQLREDAGYLEDAQLIRKLIPDFREYESLHLDVGSDYRDFFIGDRVIFPIYDEKTRLVGLGGRSVQDSIHKKSPKYQFTRDFPKASILYRANNAFNELRVRAKKGETSLSLYLCEGFLDALRFEALGMPAVAIMGSTISANQVQLLKEFNENLPKKSELEIIISFDRDEAGLRGAEDATLKLMSSSAQHTPIECRFLWPSTNQLDQKSCSKDHAKDPNDYLRELNPETAGELLASATHPPELAVLANAFSVTAEDVLNDSVWKEASRSRRYRAFSHAYKQLKRVFGNSSELFSEQHQLDDRSRGIPAVAEFFNFVRESTLADDQFITSEDFLNSADARLNHSRILAYMGSRRGELPCDEPRWERLDTAATAFNALLVDRMKQGHADTPIDCYNAVWVPRKFGGDEPRLKMMPRPEDLIIQQYMLNELLTERWDQDGLPPVPFSRSVPAVRFYREARKSITTGFRTTSNGPAKELSSQTLSFAYQIDMDVLEGRQPASDQGMYRPFSECWRDFMHSLKEQAEEIGYVYSIRLDVKRYYDRLRRYVIRDQLLPKVRASLESAASSSAGFAELVLDKSFETAEDKSAKILDLIDEHLFGVDFADPDTGEPKETDSFVGIPQGPVLSAWIGTVALFPADEEAFQFMERLNIDHRRVGYARYVDDIVLLADDPATLRDMRDAIDHRVRELELTLLAKADEIPAMSSEEFSEYLNEGRVLVQSGPTWDPPLVGDGESGWGFWSAHTQTNRQSALHLLHNVDLYKASETVLLQTVKTAFQAPDLRTSELSKAARLIWYVVAMKLSESASPHCPETTWEVYLEAWNSCLNHAGWQLSSKFPWESPIAFALEGLEHLIDKNALDVKELSATENAMRRKRIIWLAEVAAMAGFEQYAIQFGTGLDYQIKSRMQLVQWKAARLSGTDTSMQTRLIAERAQPIKRWRPFEWLHQAVALLGDDKEGRDHDPLTSLIGPARDQLQQGNMVELSGQIFRALLPQNDETLSAVGPNVGPIAIRIALTTLISIVPRKHLPNCLTRRPQLIWGSHSHNSDFRLTLPPLPGVQTSRLFSCLQTGERQDGKIASTHFEVIDFSNDPDDAGIRFLGFDVEDGRRILQPKWKHVTRQLEEEAFKHFEADLEQSDSLLLRETVPETHGKISSHDLKNAASLFRTLAHIVTDYSDETENKRELVPAWPYIAQNLNNETTYYLVVDSISRQELGNRAFVRDGGRSLRTIEVPIYEASLWRVGIAITDYLGLHDDIAKYSDSASDVALDETALSNPARYVLRAQLRKLRGAFANSQIGKRRAGDRMLPATVERSLALLEDFPSDNEGESSQIMHVLAIEAESAGMYFAFSENWGAAQLTSFLQALTTRVIGRLPLSIGQLITPDESAVSDGQRRDLSGLLSFARQLFSVNQEIPATAVPAWKILRSGVVSSGISVALEGMLASIRSQGELKPYANFDFPTDWEIPYYFEQSTDDSANSPGETKEERTLLGKFRQLISYLGYRILPASEPNHSVLNNDTVEQIKSIVQNLAEIEICTRDAESLLEWPFNIFSEQCLDLLNLDLLESVAQLIASLDHELKFEVKTVIQSAFGYDPQTKRFTDSRNNVNQVTEWMISQFPLSRNIEEIEDGGRYLRIWSEVFDKDTGKLLSISALGEPFASIAMPKPKDKEAAQSSVTQIKDDKPEPSNPSAPGIKKDDKNHPGDQQSEEKLDDSGIPTEASYDHSVETGSQSGSAGSVPDLPPENAEDIKEVSQENEIRRNSHSFRNIQLSNWGRRKDLRAGHMRIALFQADLHLSYLHPFFEACPSEWPLSADVKLEACNKLKSDPSKNEIYDSLFRAYEKPDSGHHWRGITGPNKKIPSWFEHRRRAILGRVIDSCDAFGVELLVLPEYSVRPETIDWLSDYIKNKKVAVLAGTYMNFDSEQSRDHLAAKLTLLWPLPEGVSENIINAIKSSSEYKNIDLDELKRGTVINFSRNKKYRSIALEEFFRPKYGKIEPLFLQNVLTKYIENEISKKIGTEYKLNSEIVTKLLADTELPLKHVLELICSEIFLVSSPANYGQMAEDYKAMRMRFGEAADKDDVFEDVKNLSSYLSITGNKKAPRRSILAVPAATSRSADYWIAGQAGFLAAGTATVFCNSVGEKALVGGSCFIGSGSWKAAPKAKGYISRITPYQGWSKGIYFNDRKDALNETDQAVVIVDVDPQNMMEGKPRAQTMPPPLQLVAYLPVIETADWKVNDKSILKSLKISGIKESNVDSNKPRFGIEGLASFWSTVSLVHENPDQHTQLWRIFPDTASATERAKIYHDNSNMQPSCRAGEKGLLASPSLYDWIEVDLTLPNNQQLPEITVPPWKA